MGGGRETGERVWHQPMCYFCVYSRLLPSTSGSESSGCGLTYQGTKVSPACIPLSLLLMIINTGSNVSVCDGLDSETVKLKQRKQERLAGDLQGHPQGGHQAHHFSLSSAQFLQETPSLQ